MVGLFAAIENVGTEFCFQKVTVPPTLISRDESNVGDFKSGVLLAVIGDRCWRVNHLPGIGAHPLRFMTTNAGTNKFQHDSVLAVETVEVHCIRIFSFRVVKQRVGHRTRNARSHRAGQLRLTEFFHEANLQPTAIPARKAG